MSDVGATDPLAQWRPKMPYLGQRAALRVVVGIIVSLCLAAGHANPASAQTGNSSAFGESVNLTVLPTLGAPLGVTSGPLPVSSGSAPPTYNDSHQVSSVNVALNVPLVGLFTFLNTGLLQTNAQSPTIPAPTAAATVNNLAAALNTLLTIGATSVRSTAAVGGPCGAPLTSSGTTTIENASVGGSLGVGLTIGVNPAPNTVLLDVQVGLLATQRLRVVLNEQILGGDGTTTRSLTVNAIHIFLTNVSSPGIGLISGNIIVSQSKAELSCAGASANLSITKVASPDPVAPGQQLTYR